MAVAKRIYIISDLHLGGEYPDATGQEQEDTSSDRDRGFRICTHVTQLVAFIKAIIARAQKTRIDTELVINGDIVDFLAEKREVRDSVTGVMRPGWEPFIDDPLRARNILQQIVARDKLFFDALKEFLASGNRLTVTLGNHDIEISFPQLRETLIGVLEADGKRFSIIYDGEAYQVGQVIIEHGNRYDEWNAVSHDALRRVRSVQSRLEPPLDRARAFEAPAGSFLVASVMNEIKRHFPFIDLLKPESEAAIPILLAIAPEYRNRIIAIASLVAKSRRHRIGSDGLPLSMGDIADQQQLVEANGEEVVSDILKRRLSVEDAVLLLSDASNPPVIKTDGDIDSHDFRSFWATLMLIAARSSEPWTSRLPTLLAAVGGTKKDFSFDRTQEITPYREAAERLLARGFKVVTFGHTHLAKQIEFSGGLYINTGTWADLIPFPSDIFGADMVTEHNESRSGAPVAQTKLEKFVDDMRTAKLQKHLRFMPTYARVELDEAGAVLCAKLCDYAGPSEEI